MSDSKVLESFLNKCPVAVLTQAATRAVIAEELDKIFEDHRSQQYEKTLTFSAVTAAVSDVVLRFAQNFRQAYAANKEQIVVSLTSFYNKINATETAISEALVARSAQRAGAMQDKLDYTQWEVLKGYRVYALDGNHLPETEKRLKPLRMLHDAPLPGTVVARFDLQRQLFDRAYLLEDAHAQESTVLDRVLEDANPGEVFLADRHYCIMRFMQKANKKGVFFLIRQHGRFKGVLEGSRCKAGRTSSGTVYEQIIRSDSTPDALVMRRITVELDEPTRDGETSIHLVTNLPAEVGALSIAEAYRHRWETEGGFYYLTTTLTCELVSVSQPRAALLLFSVAMLAFNIRQVVFASLYAEHDQELVDEVSHHALSVEVARYTDGMLVSLDDSFWLRLIGDSGEETATQLRRISQRIDLKKYRKHHRGPKKQVVKPPKTRTKTHVSTAKLLREAANKRP